MPKSINFIQSVPFQKRRFSGFKSRCTIFFPCRYTKARSSWVIMATDVVSFVDFVTILLKSQPPQHSSRIRTQLFLQSYTSKRRVMLGWSSAIMIAISQKSFSCYAFARADFFIFLAARTTPVYLALTLLTVPKPPLPISLMMVYSSRQFLFFILMKLFHLILISSITLSSSKSSYQASGSALGPKEEGSWLRDEKACYSATSTLVSQLNSSSIVVGLGYSFEKKALLGAGVISKLRMALEKLGLIYEDTITSCLVILLPIFQLKRMENTHHFYNNDNSMLKHSFTLILILTLATYVFTQSCHFSCSTCINSTYTTCFSCANFASKLTSIATSSGTSYGVCGTPAYSSVNGLGVFLLLTCIAAGLFLRSQHIFYFILTFQTLGLLSLIEVAYTASLNTILSGFQYLMIFSQMQNNHKQDDGALIARGMYRLNAFLTSVELSSNLTPLFVVTFLVAAVLGILLAFQKYRERRCQCISNQTLQMLLTALRTIILLTMQQMLVIIYVGIRMDTLSVGQTAMIVLYSIIVIFLLVDFNWHRVPYFRTKKLLNLAIAQRLILTVLVILPSQDTYQLIIFTIAFAIIELFFYAKSSAKTRHYVYSLLRMLSSLLIGVFIAVDLTINSERSSNISSVFATIALALLLIAFAVQVFLSVKDKCTGAGKVKNEDDLLVRANTSQKIAVLREDTMDQRTLQAHIQDSRKQSLEVTSKTHKEKFLHEENKAPNLLDLPRKQEKKFKVNKI